MPKPSFPVPISTPQPPKQEKRKFPTAQDLISHYESQGLETKQASIKAIDDLQKVLFKLVSSGKVKKERIMADTSRKLDSLHTRLAVIESKVDSKPGYGECIAIGVAAAGVMKGIGVALPRVLGAVGQIWNAVRTTTSTNSPSSSS